MALTNCSLLLNLELHSRVYTERYRNSYGYEYGLGYGTVCASGMLPLSKGHILVATHYRTLYSSSSYLKYIVSQSK